MVARPLIDASTMSRQSNPREHAPYQRVHDVLEGRRGSVTCVPHSCPCWRLRAVFGTSCPRSERDESRSERFTERRRCSARGNNRHVASQEGQTITHDRLRERVARRYPSATGSRAGFRSHGRDARGSPRADVDESASAVHVNPPFHLVDDQLNRDLPISPPTVVVGLNGAPAHETRRPVARYTANCWDCGRTESVNPDTLSGSDSFQIEVPRSSTSMRPTLHRASSAAGLGQICDSPRQK